MIYGYARVSTKGQEKNGFSLEQQEKEILDKYENAIINKEVYSAATMERPVFNSIIKSLQEGDLLVVTKLDRLARNTVEGIEIVEMLFQKKVAVHVLNIGLLEDTHMGRFFLTTLLAVAEMERNTIVERTQAGKAVARTKAGFKEGRPKEYTEEQLKHAVDLLKVHSYTQVEKLTKISISTLAREVRRLKAIEIMKEAD